VRVAIVGCGFVSALYLRTLQQRPDLRIVGVTDLIPERRELLARHAGTRAFESLQALLDQSGADIVVNLTNPSAHYAVNCAALEAGKHVYCEKPLSTRFEEARELVALAKRRGLQLSGAPCNVLSEVAQAVWRELREERIGTPRLVYAEMDDGMVSRAPYRRWVNEFGIPWPAKDEFEVGCTLEHAGYYLTWLAAFFGPAASVTRFGATTIPDKGIADLAVDAPDFTVACIRFRSGVVARLTCSIVAPHDHELRIVGDEGVLTVPDCWDYRGKASVRKLVNVRRRSMLSPIPRRVRLPPAPGRPVHKFGAASMDFARGIAELAEAIRFGRESRLSPEFCLHTNELALAIHAGDQESNTYAVSTEFAPMQPMSWAR
jgi:predicted dehydrogenase